MPNQIRCIRLTLTFLLGSCAAIASSPATPDKIEYALVLNGDPQIYAQLAEHLFHVRTGCRDLCIVVR